MEDRRLLSVNVSTYHYNDAETGANTNETQLTLANVNTNTFGKIASMTVAGQIYGQPLIMTGVPMGNGEGTHDIVIVTTETDLVYAFDAYGNNPAQGYLWKTSLLQSNESPVPESTYGSTDITPSIGITGTPVINTATNVIYVVGLFQQNVSPITYSQRIYALNISTGTNAIGPVTIAASVSGSTFNNSTYSNPGGVVTFSAFRENQRPALTLANGEVYVGWSSHGDQNPWHGWLIAFNAATLHEDYVYCDSADGEQGGIWMSGGGIAVDASGNLYFSTGNGTFDANSNTTADGDYGMSLEAMSSTLTEEGFFTPYNESSLSGADLDYGCANVILLTGQGGAYPNEVLSAGKWGVIILNNMNSLGGFNSTSDNDLGEATLAGANTSTSNVHNTMVYWNGSVYLGGDALTLQAFSVANSVLGTTPTSQTSHVFGISSAEDGQGAGLTVSSNGSSNGIVWALDNTGFLTSPSVLYAYNASNLSLAPLWTSSSAADGRDTSSIAIKFQDPVVANGHVYVAGDGSLTIYGLLTASSNTPTIINAATASPSTTVTTNSTTLSVLASDPSGDLSPNYTWSATTIPNGATAPTFSISGTNNANVSTATFTSAGTYTLTATIEDPNSGLTTTSSVTVTVVSTLTSITLTPASPTLSDGATQQFTATGYDQYGGALATQPTFTYGLNAGGAGGTINSSGLYTAPATGTGFDTVTATTGSFTASSTVAIGLLPATNQINLSSADVKVGIVADGTAITANAGIDGDGDAISSNIVGTSQTWNGSTFTIPAPTAGNTTSNVVDGAGQTITLSQYKYSTLKLLAFHVNGNETSATADALTITYVGGTTQTTSQKYSDWFTPQNNTGEYTAVTMAYRDLYNGGQGGGPFYIYGYSFALTDTKAIQSIKMPTDANFIIVAMDLVGLTVPTPAAATPSPVTGKTTSLSAVGTSPTGDAAPTYTWYTTSEPTGATAPTFSTNGTTTSNVSTATFYQAGAYTFTVAITDPTSGLSATSSVNVIVSPTLTSIVVAPATATVYDARTQQFAATGDDQFGYALSSQPSFSWTVNAGGAGGTINSTSGLYTAPASGSGTDTVKAASGSISGAAVVTVALGNPTVTKAASATPSPVTGTATALSTSATDITGDASPLYTWAATNVPSGATTPTFSPNGSAASNVSTATFYQAGAYTFTVTITDPTDSLTSTSSVNVTVNQTVTTINLTPTGPVTLYNGQTQQFIAAANDQFGKALTAQPSFTWTVPSGIGSVSATGLYQDAATGSGTAIVQASSGSIIARATVQDLLPAWLGAGSIATWNSTTKILTVTGATSIVADPGSDQPVIQANGSSAIVTINPTSSLQIHIGGLSLTNGASATVTSLGAARTATNHRVLVLGLYNASSPPLFTIDSTSQLNLTDNDLADHDGSIASVTALLAGGYNAGQWNGNGIGSSIAASTPLTTLGSGQPASVGTFDNEAVNTSDVEIRYTYVGDANLDGHVDGSDYTLIDNGFLNGLTGFNNGDFNYDGVIDGSDYALIDNAFNTQNVSLDAAVATPTADIAVGNAAPSKTSVSNVAQQSGKAQANVARTPRASIESLISLPSESSLPNTGSDQSIAEGSQASFVLDPLVRHHAKKAGNGSKFSNVLILLGTV